MVSTLPWPLWIKTSHIQQDHCKCVVQCCFHPTSRITQHKDNRNSGITQHKDNLHVCRAVLLSPAQQEQWDHTTQSACVSCNAAFTRTTGTVGSHNTKTICMCVTCFSPLANTPGTVCPTASAVWCQSASQQDCLFSSLF